MGSQTIPAVKKKEDSGEKSLGFSLTYLPARFVAK